MKPTTMNLFTGTLIPILLLSSIPAMTTRGESGLTEQLTSELQQRTAAIKSLDISWTAKNYYTAAYGQFLAKTPFADQDKIGSPEFKATELEWKGRVVWCPPKLRFEHNMPGWVYPSNRFEQHPRLAIFDGTKSQELNEHDQSLKVTSQGYVRDGDDIPGIGDARPILWIIHPFHPYLGLTSTVITRSDATNVLFEGQNLVKVSTPIKGSNNSLGASVFYFAPNLDWALVRETRTQNGRPVEDLRFTIDATRSDNSGMRVPKSWTWTRYNNQGQLKLSTSATVTNCVVNGSLDESEFAITFPPNTRVVDQRRGANVREYVVTAAGQERIIYPHELSRVTHISELANSPPAQIGRKRFSWFHWTLWSLAGGVIGIVAWRFWKARSRFEK